MRGKTDPDKENKETTMSYMMGQNFGIEHFEDWARGMEYFALAEEVGRPGEDADGAWVAGAACQSRDLAWGISQRYNGERGLLGMAGTRIDFEYDFFIGGMRSGWCYAIFGEEDVVPVAITLSSDDADYVVKRIEEKGGTATVEGCRTVRTTPLF